MELKGAESPAGANWAPVQESRRLFGQSGGGRNHKKWGVAGGLGSLGIGF